MQLFYSKDISSSGFCTLDAEESRHAVRVLRMREGDTINVTDGMGHLYQCRIVQADDRACTVEPILEPAHKDSATHKETFHETSLQERQTWLSVVVRQYKSSVTRFAKKQGIPFAWQTRYYDHIIRDQQSYETITNYINDNVSTWAIDKMYT